MTSQKLRLAVDIGGTFTDTVIADQRGAVIASSKTLTTHDDPSVGALAGAIRALDDLGSHLSDVVGVVHGTTLATNALIERRGAKVATVTTEGFRDILEIAYERRYDQYDINISKPAKLVPRALSFTISERMDVGGAVVTPLDHAAIAPLAASLHRAGVEAVAICLLHAYANPAHERLLAERLAEALPNVAISLSCEVSPEAREFDRLCTTIANAYVQPLMDGYLGAFQRRFEDAGLVCPILMMTAGGGMTTLATARRFPIRLVESGPAGGAILAAKIARDIGLDEVLSFDMGGTTAKLCLIDDATPQTSRHFEIARAARFIKGSGMPVRIPVIDMIEIGAGGGSIAAVDRLGRLTVGPESAGSDPGPVAFGRGGDLPTVTDADVVQGFLRPERFAEGQFTLAPQAAAAAIAREVGDPLDLNLAEAADGISRIVDESMASAGRMHAAESGKDLGTRTMIAFGGNGPLHATRVARSAGVSRIVVPPHPSVGSAVGFLFAPVSFEIVRSQYTLLETLDTDSINDLFRAMTAEAERVVRQGAPSTVLAQQRSAFMRYRGQGHEIEIGLPLAPLSSADISTLTTRFEEAYRQHFARSVPGMTIEVLNWAVRVASPGLDAHPSPHAAIVGGEDRTQIRCDLTGRMVEARVLDRATLPQTMRIAGPALITEPQTTTLVSADFSCAVDAVGNLILTQTPEGSLG